MNPITPPTLYGAVDNATTTLTAGYSPGSGSMVVSSATSFGSPSPSNPIRITVIGAESGTRCNYACTAVNGPVLTVSVIDGYPDVAFQIGDGVGVLDAAAYVNDLNRAVLSSVSAINTLAAGGVQGPQGPQGRQGSQGTAGTGSQGPQGASGTNGSTGPQGATGTGSQGPSGPQGASGSSGPQGVTGSQGGPGAQGSSGPQGAASTVAGPQGATGSQGPQGAAGSGGSGGGSPGGSNGSIQYNESGAFTGSQGLVYDPVNVRLGVGVQSPANILDMQSSAPIGTQAGNSIGFLNIKATDANVDQFNVSATRKSNGNDYSSVEFIFGRSVDSTPISGFALNGVSGQDVTIFGFGGSYTGSTLGAAYFQTNSTSTTTPQYQLGAGESFLAAGVNRYGNGEVSGQVVLHNQIHDMHFGCYSGYGFTYYTNQTTQIGYLSTNGTWTVTGGYVATPSALTYGSSISWDASHNSNVTLTPTGNFTLSNPANLVAGASGMITITQDSTGGRVITWGSGYRFSGGVKFVLSTAASAVDEMRWYSPDGTHVDVIGTQAFA